MLEDLAIQFSQQSRTAEIQQMIQTRLLNFEFPRHLREVVTKIAVVQNREKPFLTQPIIYTFFGDHGIAESGLCKRGNSLSLDLVRPYLNGYHALNIFSRQNRIELRLIDCGLGIDIADPKMIQRKIAKGTRNFAHDQAMSTLQLERCVKNGRELIRTRRNQISNTVGIGIQSIGSELACIMILARLRHWPLENLLHDHPAFHANDLPWVLKKLRSILNACDPVQDPMTELKNFSGFEMATALGAILQACHQKCIVLVDGFVGTCLTWLASLLFPDVATQIIIAQNGASFAELQLTQELGIEPLMRFDTPIHDGSGIALGFPLVHAACTFLNESTAYGLQSGVS